jgi:predicted nucleic acid-binding protein
VEVVVNTSIIISALLKEGLTRRMIFFSPFELYTVAYAREEIEKHRTELITRSKLDEDAFQYLLDLIISSSKALSKHIQRKSL